MKTRGYLHSGMFYCVPCSVAHNIPYKDAMPVFAENILPLSQTCHSCGKLVVEGNRDGYGAPINRIEDHKVYAPTEEEVKLPELDQSYRTLRTNMEQEYWAVYLDGGKFSSDRAYGPFPDKYSAVEWQSIWRNRLETFDRKLVAFKLTPPMTEEDYYGEEKDE